ncbi:uncharacterized protein [Triticum aestivum]|uniref:uncharacterized protein isoform X3 n=1 Tax=Triticum aestivum TaxID=4565 RepID=UPI001D02C62D|nr:uncharacterized protein LOC123112540 isoform X3 [Triticum aestivum]
MEVVISSPLWLSLVFPGSEHLHDGTQQSRSQGDKSRDGLISISHVKMIGKSTGVILLHGIRHQVKQRGFYGCSRDQCLEEIDRTDEVSIYEIKPVTIHLIPWVHMMRRIFAYQGKHHIRGDESYSVCTMSGGCFWMSTSFISYVRSRLFRPMTAGRRRRNAYERRGR